MYQSEHLETEAMLRQMLDQMPALAWRLDAAGNCDYLNGTWFAYTGADEKSLLTQGWLRLLHGDDKASVMTGLKAAIRKKIDFQCEFRLRRHDDTYRWFDAHVVPLRHDGQVSGWIGTATDANERQHALQALRDQAARSRLNFEFNPNGMMVVDQGGEILEANSSACLMFKYEPDQLLGMSVEQLLPESFRKTHRKLRRGYQENPVARRMGIGRDLLGVRSDGQSFPVEVSIGPFTMQGAQYVSVTLTDLSERVNAEREHAHMAAIVDSSTDPIISKTLSGIVTSWNKAAEQLFGYSAAEMINTPITRLFPPERLSEEETIMGNLQAGHYVRHFETQRLHKNGELIDVSVSVSPVHDNQGRIIGAAKIVRDIRERKRTEKQLLNFAAELEALVATRTAQYEQARRDLQNILDALPAMISSWDVAGCNRYINHAQQQWLGITAEQAHGKSLTAVLPADIQERLQPAVAAVLDGTPQTIETVLHSPDGLHHPYVLIHLVPELSQPGSAGFYVLIHDVTRVKYAESELRAANSELEAFTYAVAHDLRAPLRAMSGFGQALVEECGEALNEDSRDYLKEILEASARMARLIDGLLALSRSTQGNLRREWIDLSKLAEAIRTECDAAGVEGINELLPRSSHEPEWHIEKGMRAHGDPRMIESVLRNLFGNALKYSSRATQPVIRFYTEMHEGVLRYCVSDNGAGFDMAHAAQLFKPFQRLHRQDEFTGIGIGLATVQRIVQRHGGTITASAVPGQGATFCFTLGAAASKSQKPAAAGRIAARGRT